MDASCLEKPLLQFLVGVRAILYGNMNSSYHTGTAAGNTAGKNERGDDTFKVP